MFHLAFYVPATHVETVKQALFAAGAGRWGTYSECAWQTLGCGQFRAHAGARPYLGEIDQVCVVEEYKVEMICASECVQAALQALRAAHPYEQPAYLLLPIIDETRINDGVEFHDR